MKILKRYLLIFVIIFIYGCNSQTKYFYSPDKSKSITILTRGHIRYIIDGKHNKVPASNYVKISLEKVDREVGDQMVGCWGWSNFQWVMLMDKAIIIENKLDRNKFLFKESFPTREFGIPTLEDFHSGLPNCFSISLEYRDMLRVEGAISE